MFRFLLIALLFLILASIQNSFSQDEVLDSYYVRQTNYINPNFLEGKKGWDFSSRPTYCEKSLTSLPPFSDQLAYLDCTVNNEVDFGTNIAIDTSSIIGASYTLEVIAQATGTGDPKVGFFKIITQISDNTIQIVPDGKMRKYAIPMPQDSGYSVNFFGNLIGSLYIKSIRIREDVPSTLAGILNPQTGWTPMGVNEFTASNTAPEKGVSNEDEHWCKREGSDLIVKGTYEQVSTAGSADGLGAYFLPFPDSCAGTENLEIDTDAIVESGTLNFSGKSIESSGTFYSDSLLISGETSVSIYNAANKQLTLGLIDAVTGESENWGSAKLPMNTGLFAISYSYRIPIKQWRKGTTAIVTQGDFDNLDNHPYFTASVDAAAAVSQTLPWITSCTDGTIKTCTFAYGFTSAPHCFATTNTGSGNGFAQRITAISTSSISVQAVNDGGVVVDTSFNLVCFKNSEDYQKSYKQYIAGLFLQSNIKQDVEQFPLTEQKLCDSCYKGKALYKKCYEGSAASGYVLTNDATDYKGCYGHWTYTATRQIALPLAGIGAASYCELNPSTGALILIQDGTRNVSFCAEYLKD